MIFIEHTPDVEFYSSTSKGAVLGYLYVFHAAGTYRPRILRLYEIVNFSVHNIALVNVGAFYFVMDTCSNGEVYNIIIRDSNEGGLDGIDVWGTNIWIHDIEVTNKDECVTVKSPASYILIESIYCNCSGGCAIGSLGVDTDTHNIEYSHIYTQESNQVLMIKSNAGSGSVYSYSLNNFMGHSNAYTLDIDGHWSSQTTAAGDGVTFDLGHGTCSNGATRPPPSFNFCAHLEHHAMTSRSRVSTSGLRLVVKCFTSARMLMEVGRARARGLTTLRMQSLLTLLLLLRKSLSYLSALKVI